jgi:hypothetical protein
MNLNARDICSDLRHNVNFCSVLIGISCIRYVARKRRQGGLLLLQGQRQKEDKCMLLFGLYFELSAETFSVHHVRAVN